MGSWDTMQFGQPLLIELKHSFDMYALVQNPDCQKQHHQFQNKKVVIILSHFDLWHNALHNDSDPVPQNDTQCASVHRQIRNQEHGLVFVEFADDSGVKGQCRMLQKEQ